MRGNPIASALAIVLCLAWPTAATAGTIAFPLNNSGTIAFLSPFPNIEIKGMSTQPMISAIGTGDFLFDLVVHAAVPNGTGSLLSGLVTFDFGNANIFEGTLDATAVSSPPVIDPITQARTTILTAPFSVTSGTGMFASATGSGLLILTSRRASDVSPTSTFTSTGSVSVTAPAVVPEPSMALLLASGVGVLVTWRKARRSLPRSERSSR